MNTKLLFLAAAAAFATASCSQESKTETTETTTTPSGAEATTTTTTTVDTATYRSSADQLANQVATDLSLTDAAAKARLQQIYYSRGRAMRDLDTRFATDTTGRYAALKAANDATTTEVKTVVTDPAQYATYTGNQGNYYAGPYTTTTTTTTTTAAHKPSLGARVGQGSGIKKLENNDDDRKVKYENGAKIKRSDDGSLKIKRADGTKIKIDENGHKTVKKGLF
ncbi:hypothetical protein GO988_07065 [Hymenobacter sp. HMF4947]|uniref:Centromere protein J C-terminal domain-containing protein n=1 Tax=Hymenobacter ginkgonis TaxID=2682976 RepID=A0A7K1TCG5_9BACT|nr:hypothetical protein [Hymenobacter ginkgonis]MVN76080.1 hypothetical protein [Hymenobacter ginkgonis]